MEQNVEAKELHSLASYFTLTTGECDIASHPYLNYKNIAEMLK